MNVSEAVRTQSLLAWITTTGPDTECTDGMALVDARFLADRARRALGAGPDADQIEAALRHRITTHPPVDEGAAGDRLVRLAELLQPCPRPDAEGGWDWCAHAEPWPCVITRAAWIAAGQRDGEARR